MTRYVTRSEEETARFGGAIAKRLRAGDSLLLKGEMGSGKSVLARGVARYLGVKGPMASPTFTLMQPYRGKIPVYHLDLYRMEDPDEFYAAGLDEFVGGDGVAIVEWPMEGIAPPPCVCLCFSRGEGDDERIIDLMLLGMEDRTEGIRMEIREWEASP